MFCFFSIQRKNPLFKTKDRSKELMPYKHQVLWTLCFGGVFLVLDTLLWSLGSGMNTYLRISYLGGILPSPLGRGDQH